MRFLGSSAACAVAGARRAELRCSRARLGAAPIGVRYRIEPPMVHAADASDLAAKQAGMYLSHRFGGSSPVTPTAFTPAQCAAYRVEGAAGAEYALPSPDAFGATDEELLFLVRAGVTLLVTFRYPSQAIDPLVLATFRSVARSSLVWDPTYPPTPPNLWPASSFVGPGLATPLLPHRERQIAYLVPALSIAPGERDAVWQAIDGLVTGSEPPWHPLAHADVHAAVSTLLAAAPSAPGFAHMVQTVVADVRSWRDMRGFALLLARAANAAWGPVSG